MEVTLDLNWMVTCICQSQANCCSFTTTNRVKDLKQVLSLLLWQEGVTIKKDFINTYFGEGRPWWKRQSPCWWTADKRPNNLGCAMKCWNLFKTPYPKSLSNLQLVSFLFGNNSRMTDNRLSLSFFLSVSPPRVNPSAVKLYKCSEY